MKFGSMGEMPPSTMGRSGFSRRTAFAPARHMAANIFQSGSTLKSQCERLFGSFHNITASTINDPLYARRSECAFKFQLLDVLSVALHGTGLADPGFAF